MPNPTFSVITATHNRPQLLERMIESVLQQTFTDWELIIVDDSTNNETKKRVQKYINTEQILYTKNANNKGALYSRNRGLNLANGKWITFLDDDDYYVEKDSLSKVHKIIKQKKASWFTFNNIHKNGNLASKGPQKQQEANYITDYLYGKKYRETYLTLYKTRR